MVDVNTIAKFVKKKLDEGYSEEQIKNVLVKKGLKEALVVKIIEKVKSIVGSESKEEKEKEEMKEETQEQKTAAQPTQSAGVVKDYDKEFALLNERLVKIEAAQDAIKELLQTILKEMRKKQQPKE